MFWDLKHSSDITCVVECENKWITNALPKKRTERHQLFVSLFNPFAEIRRFNFHETRKNLILNGNSKREIKQKYKLKTVWYTFKTSFIFIFKQRCLCEYNKDLSTTYVIYEEPVASRSPVMNMVPYLYHMLKMQ